MKSSKQTYRDRFGNEWSVRVHAGSGKPRRLTFTCKEFRLIAEEEETEDRADLTSARLKDFFCDAERVLEHGGQKWHVGFRQRVGRGGRIQGGMHTRFRSESGEVRYANGMVHFRHMPQAKLREHLVAAVPAVRAPTQAIEAK